MTTVLPTPAPPKRPIFPPFTNGAIRSMTLMPVSKISVLGSSSVNFGVARHIKNSPQRGLADGGGEGTAGVPDLHAARDTVGAAHRNGANLVLADVLLHFSRQPYRYG